MQQKSTWKVLPRSIQMHIMKETEDDAFWERLLKVKNRVEPPFDVVRLSECARRMVVAPTRVVKFLVFEGRSSNKHL